MDEWLVTFCRTGALGPLEPGMSASEVIGHIGEPGRINLVQGDDCWQRYLYPEISLFLRCRRPGERHRGEKWHLQHLRLSTITIPVRGDAPPRLDDVHRLLADRGVEMTRDDGRSLSRTVDHVRIHVSGEHGLVSRFEATRRHVPGPA